MWLLRVEEDLLMASAQAETPAEKSKYQCKRVPQGPHFTQFTPIVLSSTSLSMVSGDQKA